MISAVQRAAWNVHSPFEGMANELHKKFCMVRVSYDFAVQGGAIGTFNLLDDDGLPVILPNKAIIVGGFIDIITPIVSTSNDGTIALSANSAGDLKAAVDGDTLSGIVATIPVNTAATSIKLTADRYLTGSIAVHAFTAGKFDLYVKYLLGR